MMRLAPGSLLCIAMCFSSLRADEPQRKQLIEKGIQYLTATGQAENGSFSESAGPAVTALATTALLRNGRGPSDPAVSRALRYLEGFVNPDGGIYQPKSLYMNYETCVALQCFHAANENGKYDERIAKAKAFLRGLQWDGGEGIERDDFSYGGAGYGSHKRPDLSNTAFFIDTMHDVASSEEDREALQRALIFVSRCQNLESQYNQTPFSTKNPDGGFYYTPAAGGSSQAGATEQGGLRSYASMTYAGLKSMIYAGVDADDPRVQAATTWLQKNYDLGTNPGMGDAGLYYYYHTFAKALQAMGSDTFTDEHQQVHSWRQDLIQTLADRQRADGSWINANERWLEGDANLVTAYALLALSYCEP